VWIACEEYIQEGGKSAVMKAGILICAALLWLITASCSGQKASEVTALSSADADIGTYVVQSTPSLEMTAVFGNVKIGAGADVTVYETMSKYGDVLGEEPNGKVFKVLEKETDADGGVWYRIYSDFGSAGWITGMNCKPTDEKCSDVALTALLDSIDNGITYYIEGSIFSLDIGVDNFNLSRLSELPERALCDTDDTPDKNNLLSNDMKWEIFEGYGVEFVSVLCTVNLVMLEYLWNVYPEFSSMYGSELKNDLARISILAEYQGDGLKIFDVSYTVKYDDPNLLDIKPIFEEDLGLLNGPVLGMSDEEVTEALDLNEADGLDLSINGSGTLGYVGVRSEKYMTIRGLKVGDTIETVEKLYGKPDVGFSGDSSVTYQANLLVDGQLAINDHDSIVVYYEDGFVSGFCFNRVYLD
jgi:hypothetical protein